ncbi:MAG: 1-deoxy-D-xylulose-5-phosphate synthase [Clostridiales bacterium]|nr:1-deoxy-D-xylulose-5-phosphate synthase [Clostridiales bacterium]MCF8021186.1 1-deoxy-D-xylulose-5-phosphate synthase [Clostridiales bacterium]
MPKILQKINTPEELSGLTLAEMETLAQELRDDIIYTVSKNGGHLAPNLGVVELTIAMHRVFSSPKDKIIWDVGHQSYTHKLLTSRRDKFHTLRQLGGISGFPRPEESDYDAFATGHSSTSISAGLGMAISRDLKGENNEVISVIGDGAMTAGMSFEALNHAGHLKNKLIVVLNDNEMSISPNVGGLASYFSRLRSDPMYYRSKDEIEQLLRKIPSIGSTVLKVVERLKDSLKYLVVPGMFFEELGYVYFGPVDGHDIKSMISVMEQARSVKGPVLIHVITRKGKGYQPAEENADKFHGTGPFEIDNGKPLKDKSVPSYTEVFGNFMVKEAASNEKIIAITAAMGSGTGLNKFAENYPGKFFDVGIAEQHAVTMSAGMAKSGYRPVVAIYSTFLQRAYDQVLHDVCLQKLPVVFSIDRGGLVGDDGPTHHGLFDLSYLRILPNIILMSPKDENELQSMLKTALCQPGPCAVRYPRGAGVGVALEEDPPLIPVGRAEVLSEGEDVTLIAIGNCTEMAKNAAETLFTRGIKAAVINARFIKPLDEECILHYSRRTGKVITIEEHALSGGFGSAVLELLNSYNQFNIRTERIGIPDCFVEHGNPDMLRTRYGLTVEYIVDKALNMHGGKYSGEKPSYKRMEEAEGS